MKILLLRTQSNGLGTIQGKYFLIILSLAQNLPPKHIEKAWCPGKSRQDDQWLTQLDYTITGINRWWLGHHPDDVR